MLIQTDSLQVRLCVSACVRALAKHAFTVMNGVCDCTVYV